MLRPFYIFISPFNWPVFFHQEAYVLVKKKRKKKVLFSAGKQNLTGPHPCLPLLISLSIMLFAPPCLPPPLFLPWFLSFSLTLPQSYIKSYQPLEEDIKVLEPVKSYKLSALQYHYMLRATTPQNFSSVGIPVVG